ncbi:NADH-cytochrome b5 reductase-like [Octopus vulgaris]|uniref:NADH-cytochrome b5 reductase n=1 Tax=Octopus vulgaris TaxID=6645 RepID=A0AA36BDH1_OCTVU|nr:NADH-cytochrome b5 reductase-like [Octopus vulgaris]
MSSGAENLQSAPATAESKPQKPSESECCGSGCKPCVFDIYEQRLKAWEKEQQRYRLSSEIQNVETLLSPVAYKPFVLRNIQQVTKDSFCYRFCAPTEHPLNINLGQHVILRATLQGEEIFRQYTPISDMEAPGYFDLLIKLYPTGLMSQHIKDWQLGTVAEFKGPFGSFSENLLKKWPRLCLLASGTGIAPMSAIVKSILNDEDNETVIQLLFASRFYEDILLKEDIESWADYWNFRVLYCLSQEQESSNLDPYEERLHFGRITKTLIESKVEDVANNFFLICGSRVFNKDMANFLTELGLSEEQYFIF